MPKPLSLKKRLLRLFSLREEKADPPFHGIRIFIKKESKNGRETKLLQHGTKRRGSQEIFTFFFRLNQIKSGMRLRIELSRCVLCGFCLKMDLLLNLLRIERMTDGLIICAEISLFFGRLHELYSRPAADAVAAVKDFFTCSPKARALSVLCSYSYHEYVTSASTWSLMEYLPKID
jgi:hypothetical protein